jgi:hypothetical protein
MMVKIVFFLCCMLLSNAASAADLFVQFEIVQEVSARFTISGKPSDRAHSNVAAPLWSLGSRSRKLERSVGDG